MQINDKPRGKKWDVTFPYDAGVEDRRGSSTVHRQRPQLHVLLQQTDFFLGFVYPPLDLPRPSTEKVGEFRIQNT